MLFAPIVALNAKIKKDFTLCSPVMAALANFSLFKLRLCILYVFRSLVAIHYIGGQLSESLLFDCVRNER